MTPQRITEILGWIADAPTIMLLTVDGSQNLGSMTGEEFRELLTAYGRECEWAEAVGCFDTSCGQAESGAGWADFCPHCGGKVVTR